MSDYARQSGRTTAICKAAKEIGASVVCASHAHARQVSREHKVDAFSMSQDHAFIGRSTPVLWDHFAVDQLLMKIERLRAELKECEDAYDSLAEIDTKLIGNQRLRIEELEEMIDELRALPHGPNRTILFGNHEAHVAMDAWVRAKDKRIEELEEGVARLEDDKAFWKNPPNGVWMEKDKIDTAWTAMFNRVAVYGWHEEWVAYAVAILQLAGIVACKECGGSGQGGGDPNALTESCWPCKYCHGHGWVKEDNDE